MQEISNLLQWIKETEFTKQNVFVEKSVVQAKSIASSLPTLRRMGIMDCKTKN